MERRNSLHVDADFKRGQLAGVQWVFQFWGRRPPRERDSGRAPETSKLDMVAKLSRLPSPGGSASSEKPLALRFEFDPDEDNASIIAKELAEKLELIKVRVGKRERREGGAVSLVRARVADDRPSMR